VDAGVEAGQELPTTFDALLAKVIAWGPSRDVARRRLADALARTEVAGSLKTNLTQLRAVLEGAAFAAGALHTNFLAEHRLALAVPDEAEAAAVAASVTRTPVATMAAPYNWARRPWR
jgi:acetyl/propionyl-CoA carboxylase alpha subunit